MTTLREKSVRYLVRQVEEVLAAQNEKGEFWTDHGRPAIGPTDYQQFAYYPLAWLFTLTHPDNPWRGDERLRAAVERSFRNNLAVLCDDGDFATAHHDHGTGKHAGNWRAFTWLRAWELMREHLDPRLSHACEDGLRKAFASVRAFAKIAVVEKRFGENYNIRNHPVWYLTATFALARQFGDAKAQAWAAEHFARVCATQHPAGVWFEHDGPVVVYHHIAMSGLSHYHALSGNAEARAALERSLQFCRLFTYPNGHPCEVLDGRTRYTGHTMSILPAAWAHSPAGRAMLHFLLDRLLEQPLGGGYQTHGGWLGLPFFTQFARDLPEHEADGALPAPLAGDGVHEPAELPVCVIRKGPWTVALSGFTRPEAPGNRWCLDYQAHCSVFHERAGLIVGGGGAKRQAAFSLFTGGARPLGLPCLALSGHAETTGEAAARLRLDYSGFVAHLDAEAGNHGVTLTVRVDRPAEGECAPEPLHVQLPFPMKGDAPIEDGSGTKHVADMQLELAPEQVKDKLCREGLFSMEGFEGARALLHLRPYNTHWRDGWSHREKAMGVVAQPLRFGQARKIVIRA